MPSAAPARVVVIGAGIAGLAAAHALSRAGRAQPASVGVEVLVLEAGAEAGGKLRLGDLAGRPVDEGAEALLARRPEAVELAVAAGLGDDVVHPATTAAAIAVGGRLRGLPPRHAMGVPTDVRSLAATRMFGARDLLRARRDYRMRHSPDPAMPGDADPLDVAVGPYVTRRMGAAVLDRLIEPLLAGVYAGRADSLSLAATLPQLAAAMRGADDASLMRGARRVRAKSRSDGPVFAGIRGGVGRLPAAVLAASGAELRTSAAVRDVTRTPHGWQVAYGPRGREQIEPADAVVVAVPAAPARRMLAGVAPLAAVSLAQVQYASVAVVLLAVPRPALPRQLTGSGFLVPPSAGRLVKAVTVTSSKWGWQADGADDLVFLRASVGRLGDEHDLQLDDDDLVAAVLRDLAVLCGLIATPVDARVARWGGALPQYDVGHLGRMAAVRTALEAPHLATLALAGAAYEGVGIAACIASGQKAADRVLGALGARGAVVATAQQ